MSGQSTSESIWSLEPTRILILWRDVWLWPDGTSYFSTQYLFGEVAGTWSCQFGHSSRHEERPESAAFAVVVAPVVLRIARFVRAPRTTGPRSSSSSPILGEMIGRSKLVGWSQSASSPGPRGALPGAPVLDTGPDGSDQASSGEKRAVKCRRAVGASTIR
jgi:hypothetical protein